MRRHTPPRREAGKGTANGATSGAGSGGVVGTLSESSGHARPGDNIQSVDYLIPDVTNTLGGASQSGGFRTTDLDNQGTYIPEVSNPLTHRMHKGVNTTMDEGQTMVAYSIMPMQSGTNYKAREVDVAQPLMAGGPVGGNQGGDYVLAFSAKDSGHDAGEISPTLRGMTHDGSHANGGGQVAVAFESRFARNGRGAPDAVVPPLKAQSGQTGKGDAAPLVAYQDPSTLLPFDTTQITHPENRSNPRSGDPAGTLPRDGHPLAVALGFDVAISNWMVRRLTPRECCRLQGFDDDYLDVEYRGKPAADGPKYKALGNSMAVPVMSWLGKRINRELKRNAQ